MFEEIDVKLKKFATVVYVIGSVLSVIAAIAMIATGEDLVISGLVVAIVGVLSSWLCGLMLYGFGELIGQNIQQTEFLSRLTENKPAPDGKATWQKIQKQLAENDHVQTCPQCGTVQPANRSCCFECGEKFE